MTKTKKILVTAPFVILIFSFATLASAQEWKIFSDHSPPSVGSLKIFLETTLGAENEPSKVHQRTPGIEVHPFHSTDRELLRLNNDRNREYAREGSWAPLETKPGEESFHLLTF